MPQRVYCTFYAFQIGYDRERIIFFCFSFTLRPYDVHCALCMYESFWLLCLSHYFWAIKYNYLCMALFLFIPSFACCCIVIVVGLNIFEMFFHRTLVGPCWCSLDYNNSVLSHSNTVSHNSSISFCSLIVQTCVTYMDLVTYKRFPWFVCTHVCVVCVRIWMFFIFNRCLKTWCSSISFCSIDFRPFIFHSFLFCSLFFFLLVLFVLDFYAWIANKTITVEWVAYGANAMVWVSFGTNCLHVLVQFSWIFSKQQKRSQPKKDWYWYKNRFYHVLQVVHNNSVHFDRSSKVDVVYRDWH